MKWTTHVTHGTFGEKTWSK